MKIPKVALMIDTQVSYGRELVRGITDFEKFAGPWVFFSEPVGLEKMLGRLGKFKFDGIIAHASDGRVVRKLSRMTDSLILAITNNLLEEYHCITGNYDKDGKLGAEYFIKKGFKRLAFCGVEKCYWSRKRSVGFCEAGEKAGREVSVYEHAMDPQAGGWEAEFDRMGAWLGGLEKPTGVMCCNDDQAKRVLQCCKIAGIRVPTELAVLGVDDDDMVCDLTSPKLSSLRVNVRKAGYEAAELLGRLIGGEKMGPQKIVVEPVTIVTRQSTEILAIADREVAEAMVYISRHVKGQVQVEEVAKHVKLSRRQLERRFEEGVGCSIYEEIRRKRMELVCRMLLDTDHSVLRIARALGYNGSEHIARLFRREKGMTLVEYRKKYRRRD